MAAEDSLIRFFHGKEADIDAKIADSTITAADLIITSDTDSLFYVDSTKTKHKIGGGGDAESTQDFEVNLGEGGSIGGLESGDTIPAGTSLDELIQLLTQKAVSPEYVAPGVTLARATGGTAAGTYEVGTTIDALFTSIFTQNDAGALTNLEIKKGDELVASSSTSPFTMTEASSFAIGEETVKFTAVATYADGPVKNNNLGQPDATGQIVAGSKTSTAISYVGKRKAFYGAGVGAAPELTSDVVRGLSGGLVGPVQGSSFNVPVAVGQQYVIFAYPATLRDVNQVMYVETNDTGCAANFTKSTVSVEGANGAAGVDYKTYVMELATPAAATMTFKVTI